MKIILYLTIGTRFCLINKTNAHNNNILILQFLSAWYSYDFYHVGNDHVIVTLINRTTAVTTSSHALRQVYIT